MPLGQAVFKKIKKLCFQTEQISRSFGIIDIVVNYGKLSAVILAVLGIKKMVFKFF